MENRLFLEETVMMVYIFRLRKLIKEFHEGLNDYKQKPFSVKEQLWLSEIQREIRKMLKEQDNWSLRENKIYLKVFPRVPQVN